MAQLMIEPTVPTLRIVTGKVNDVAVGIETVDFGIYERRLDSGECRRRLPLRHRTRTTRLESIDNRACLKEKNYGRAAMK